MDFYMYHGRLSEEGGATTIDGEPIDDWGFEGPRLEGCVGFHCTYGVDGHFNVWFESNNARNRARDLTGWETWDDNALTVQFSPHGDLIKAWSPERNRWEYFGDWGLK